MFDGARHVMELDRTHPSGAQEWFCPTCGRRLVMQWPPNYKKIVLEPGDEYANHSATSMGATLSPSAEMRGEALPPTGPLAADAPAGDPVDEPDPHEPPPPWLKWLQGYDPDQDRPSA